MDNKYFTYDYTSYKIPCMIEDGIGFRQVGNEFVEDDIVLQWTKDKQHCQFYSEEDFEKTLGIL